MKERPILFSAPMVRAILEGRKTQTRRVIKPQPDADGISDDVLPANPYGYAWRDSGDGVWHCPYGQPGDRLWVRETFAIEHCVEHDQEPPHSDGRPTMWPDDPDHPRWLQAHYKATDRAPDLCCERENCAQCRDYDMGPHWRPSIHMPRWASRIDLEVTGVRVERLQDISNEDARAEGVMPEYADRCASLGHPYNALPLFCALWGSISGPGSWDENPWVWVVEFKRVKP